MLNQLLLDSIKFFRNNLFFILKISLPMFIVIEAFDVWYVHNYILDQTKLTSKIILPILLGMMLYPVYTASLIFYIDAIIHDRPINVMACWRAALVRWVPMFVLYVMYGVVVMLGVLAFIVPGVVFIVRFAFAEFNLLLDQRGPISAMNVSREQTKDVFWLVLGGFLVITVVIHGFYYGLILLFQVANVTSQIIDSLLNVLLAVLYLFYIVFSYRVYHYVQESAGKIGVPT